MSKKSRKLIRSGGDPQAESEIAHETGDAVDPYSAYADKDWNFRFLPDAEPEPADERGMHRLMRAWRHGRASRSLGQVLGDAYVAIFAILLIGAMLINVLVNQQRNAAGCVSASCQSGRTLLPWAIMAGCVVVSIAAARMFGPVLASAAEGFWLMDSPLSRTRLLGRRLFAACGIAFLVGGIGGALLALLAGSSPMAIGGWGVADGLVSAATIAIAAVEQTYEKAWLTMILNAVCAVGMAGLVVLMVLVSLGRFTLGAPLPEMAPWYVAAGAAAVWIIATFWAFRRLEQIRRARLLSGGSLVSGMQGAMFALDLGLARDILTERQAVARGYVKPTPGRGIGTSALVHRDFQRLWRFPKPFLGLIASALVPYAADALGLGYLMPFLAALALVAALIPFFTTLRVLSRTGGLARTFPFSTDDLRRTAMVVPSILTLVWCIAVYPAVAGLAGGLTRDVTSAVVATAVIGAAGIFGAMRWVTAKQVDFNKPMMATGAGAVQPGLIFNLFRGIDVAATVTAPMMLGANPAWGIGIALIWYFIILNGGKSMEEMQAEQVEAKKELDAERDARRAAKSGQTGPKTVIARPTPKKK